MAGSCVQLSMRFEQILCTVICMRYLSLVTTSLLGLGLYALSRVHHDPSHRNTYTIHWYNRDEIETGSSVYRNATLAQARELARRGMHQESLIGHKGYLYRDKPTRYAIAHRGRVIDMYEVQVSIPAMN